MVEPIDTHYRSCNLCEALCGIAIRTQGEEIVSIRGDERDPLSKGYICPKAVALQDVHRDPERLKHPVKRTADGWQRISWQEAFATVAKAIRDIQDKYGRDAVGVYTGNPNVHDYGFIFHGLPFLKSLKTRNRYSAASLDQLPHYLMALHMFGNRALLPVPDIDRTDYFLIVGANPAVSNGSVMSAPGMPRRLKEIRRRGGKVILIDPRRSETAALADRHHFIRPGTDVFLLLALLHTVFAEGLDNFGKLVEYSDGRQKIENIVRDYPPQRVADITGISADEIVLLAREFAAAQSAVCYGRLGVSVQEFGSTVQWLIAVLNIATGNFDRPGGAMFSLPAFDTISFAGAIGETGTFDRWRSRVRDLPEQSGELPSATLAEEMVTPGPGQIRLLLTIAGNPVLAVPNGQKLEKALPELEFMAAIDFYINETTKHANIILPPTSALERDHYNVMLNVLTVRNIAKYSPALFAPEEDARHSWEIFRELRVRTAARGFFGKLKSFCLNLLLRQLPPRRFVDLGLRFGPYGGKWKPFSGLNLRKVTAQKHGVDLGPLQPCLPQRLYTKTKRIELAPRRFLDDLTRVEQKLAAPRDPEYDMLLIGRRHLRSNNSWMHNSKRLVRGKQRCTMLLHPEDARQRNIGEGDIASVYSHIGRLDIPVEISSDIMPGVVSIPHGWGHNRRGIQLATAQQHPGVSVNDITDDRFIDAFSGNAALNGIPVKICRHV